MKIGITIKINAYTPEAYAYRDYLSNIGHEIQLDLEENLSPNNDLNIYFMGVKLKKNNNALEIHEYQSLSTPPLASIKDSIKSIANCKPDGRIFLSHFVKDKLNFKDEKPFIFRDMGVDRIFYKKSSSQKIFDIVYCGSLNNRPGLIENIIKLSSIGFKLCIIGNIDDENYTRLNEHPNITLTGKLSKEEIKKCYDISRLGLNFTPNIYPYKHQTSTKTIEYLASGLSIVSNKYPWIVKFCKDHEFTPIWLEDLINSKIIKDSPPNPINMESYCWENILEKSKINEFIEGLYVSKYSY